ncbi:hypothetical protein [Nitrosomonas sp. Nm51]|uniref:hypothetical protein n=1 Tax=Nitrosomonas sp. Nm51 TaxID=133720 RepID=UPI00115FD404|nr:hypothetical protein [Nitrosomonas sp. Nm51]
MFHPVILLDAALQCPEILFRVVSRIQVFKISRNVVPVSPGSLASNGTSFASQIAPKGTQRVRQLRCSFSGRSYRSIRRPLRILIRISLPNFLAHPCLTTFHINSPLFLCDLFSRQVLSPIE